MNTEQAYNNWASQYDTNINKTRDLEGIAFRTVLSGLSFKTCLEIGCGTGKNTVWLMENAKQVTSVDFSPEMLAKAKEKITDKNVEFVQGDITREWTFRKRSYELASFSLVLEHIEDLDHIFKETSRSLKAGGHVYIGELHPFKQYSGSKARFDTDTGQHVLDCFIHNISDFILSANKYDLNLVTIQEYFDNDNRTEIPRILTILLKKV